LGAGVPECRGVGVGAMHSGGVLMVLPGFNGRMHRPYGGLGYWPNASPLRFLDIAPTKRIPPLCAKEFWVPGVWDVGVSG